MAKRIEALLNKNVWSIAQKFQDRYKSQELWLSAAVLALKNLSAEERDLVIDAANGFTEQDDLTVQKTPRKTLQQAFYAIKEMADVEKQQPGTIYRILSPEQQADLHELLKAIGPDLNQKKKRKKA